jgi:hypothetical protein
VFAFREVVLLLHISERLVLFTLAPVLGKPAEFVLRVKEYSHNVGRIEVGLEVVLIELPPAKIDTRREVGRVDLRGLLLRILEVSEDVVHACEDLV